MKTVIEMAREADKPDETCWLAYEIDFLERFAELVRADERATCEEVCDDLYRAWILQEDEINPPDAIDCKRAIRARGNT